MRACFVRMSASAASRLRRSLSVLSEVFHHALVALGNTGLLSLCASAGGSWRLFGTNVKKGLTGDHNGWASLRSPASPAELLPKSACALTGALGRECLGAGGTSPRLVLNEPASSSGVNHMARASPGAGLARTNLAGHWRTPPIPPLSRAPVPALFRLRRCRVAMSCSLWGPSCWWSSPARRIMRAMFRG